MWTWQYGAPIYDAILEILCAAGLFPIFESLQ